MNNIKDFVKNNPDLVSMKESVNYPGLFVLKYRKSVFYKARWNESPFLLECRGQVVDADFNVVCRPFSKIFNYQENDAGYTWNANTYVLVTKKVNGFMATLTNVKGKLIISTTGSLDSDFVGYAHDYLKNITPSMCKPFSSYMFEIVHPKDPHIVQEKFGAHFLAIVEHNVNHHYKFDNSIQIEDAINNFEPLGIFCKDEDKIVWKFGELLEHIKTVEHEGYVIINPQTNETLKIKSRYYLFQKFLARVGTKKLIDGIRTGTIKQRIDEEYYEILELVVEYGIDAFSFLEEQERLELLRTMIEKKYAQ